MNIDDHQMLDELLAEINAIAEDPAARPQKSDDHEERVERAQEVMPGFHQGWVAAEEAYKHKMRESYEAGYKAGERHGYENGKYAIYKEVRAIVYPLDMDGEC